MMVEVVIVVGASVVVVVVVDVFDDGLDFWKSPFEGSKSASSLAHLWQRYGQISTKLAESKVAVLQRVFVP